MLRICNLMNRLGGNYIDFENSCLAVNAPLFTYIKTGSWSWRDKVEWELELTLQHSEDYFIFTDSYDFLCVGDVSRMYEVVKEREILLPCDRLCHPFNLIKEYDNRRKAISPWQFVCGSGPAGQGKYISKAIEWGLQRYGWVGRGANDQSFWTFVYLYGGFGELDQQCKLSCHLYDAQEGDLRVNKDKTVTNMITGEDPQFLHAPKGTWAWIPPELIPPRREPRL